MQRCSTCKASKDLNDFSFLMGTQTKRRVCNRCSEKNKRWRKGNPDKKLKYARKGHLKKRYGITPQEYDELHLKQNGVCAICQRPQCEAFDNLSVDHKHDGSKAVRGLLCTKCNTGIGVLQDDPLVLFRAIQYLIKYE